MSSPPTRRAMMAGACALFGCRGVRAEERQRLSLLTGAAGGVFNQYGPALARAVAAQAPLDLDLEPTGGSNDNLRALARGDADLGLSSLGPAFDAWHGRKPFLAGPYRSLRALFPMYETPFAVMVLASSGLAAVSDLNGRTVGTGPAGGPSEAAFKGLAKSLGIAPKIVAGPSVDLARKVASGELDALWSNGPTPMAAFLDAQGTAETRILGLSPKEIEALKTAFGYVTPATIPAGTYAGQPASLTTASIWNFVLATDRLPDDQAYLLTRAALRQTATLAREVPAATGTNPAFATADTFMTFHPGAVRYYREIGITLSAAVTDS